MILGKVTEAGATADSDARVQLVRTKPGHLDIVIEGELATPAASALQAAMLDALTVKDFRIHLDLTRVTGCSPAGVAALASCLAVARQLEGRVGVSVAGAAGRRALLRSLAQR